jgi:hypothetical protein
MYTLSYEYALQILVQRLQWVQYRPCYVHVIYFEIVKFPFEHLKRQFDIFYLQLWICLVLLQFLTELFSF